MTFYRKIDKKRAKNIEKLEKYSAIYLRDKNRSQQTLTGLIRNQQKDSKLAQAEPAQPSSDSEKVHSTCKDKRKNLKDSPENIFESFET